MATTADNLIRLPRSLAAMAGGSVLAGATKRGHPHQNRRSSRIPRKNARAVVDDQLTSHSSSNLLVMIPATRRIQSEFNRVDRDLAGLEQPIGARALCLAPASMDTPWRRQRPPEPSVQFLQPG